MNRTFTTEELRTIASYSCLKRHEISTYMWNYFHGGYSPRVEESIQDGLNDWCDDNNIDYDEVFEDLDDHFYYDVVKVAEEMYENGEIEDY